MLYTVAAEAGGRDPFNLDDLFDNLPEDEDSSDDKMLIYHHYDWWEAVQTNLINMGRNQRLRRLSMDVLLPGPTSEDQIELLVKDDGNTLYLKYIPPLTFLNPRRTAVRTAAIAGIADGMIAAAIAPTSAMARVNSHDTCLTNIRHSESRGNYEVEINLPFAVDPYFCTRDDYGVDGAARGSSIATYRHENAGFHAANQFVWVLHIEMTDAARPKATPSKPTGGVDLYAQHA